MEGIMLSAEEKSLKKIREDFTKAVKQLKNNKLEESKKSFEKIIAGNKDSSYTSIMQVLMRSNVYKDFIEFKQENKNNSPDDNKSLLDEGLLMLNKGKLEKAESYFNKLIENKFSSPFLNYLLALLNIKKGETETAIDYLKMSFEKDASLKIHAFNESDFDILKENEDYKAIIEL